MQNSLHDSLLGGYIYLRKVFIVVFSQVAYT
jgi:hypothetical protein